MRRMPKLGRSMKISTALWCSHASRCRSSPVIPSGSVGLSGGLTSVCFLLFQCVDSRVGTNFTPWK